VVKEHRGIVGALGEQVILGVVMVLVVLLLVVLVEVVLLMLQIQQVEGGLGLHQVQAVQPEMLMATPPLVLVVELVRLDIQLMVLQEEEVQEHKGEMPAGLWQGVLALEELLRQVQTEMIVVVTMEEGRQLEPHIVVTILLLQTWGLKVQEMPQGGHIQLELGQRALVLIQVAAEEPVEPLQTVEQEVNPVLEVGLLKVLPTTVAQVAQENSSSPTLWDLLHLL
jgi:hypothetical protein